MFLKRVTRHIKEQNWVAAIVDLVVVIAGIFIALQVNDWHQQIQLENRIKSALSNVQENLLSDISFTDEALKRTEEQFSLLGQIQSGELTTEDYSNPDNAHLFRVAMQFYPFDIQNAGYQTFNEFRDLSPQEFAEITKQIDFYYIALNRFYETNYDSQRALIEERYSYLEYQYPWFNDWRNSRLDNEQIIEFFATDPIYKNWVSRHARSNHMGLWGAGRLAHWHAIKLYLEINRVLEHTSVAPSLNSRFPKQEGNRLDLIAGDYANDQTSEGITLSNLDDRLIVYREQNPSIFLAADMIFYPIGNDRFKSEQYGLWELLVNREDGKVVGFELTDLIKTSKLSATKM